MSATPIQALHEKASEHYLRGEYREALEAWEELLGIDPANEEALEGSRMSRLLMESSGEGGPEFALDGGAISLETIPDAQSPPDLDRALSIFDTPKPVPPAEVPSASLEGIQLDDLLREEPPLEIPSAAPEAPARDEVALAPLETGTPIPSFRAFPPALSESASENELTRRVQDLLSQSRAARNDGRHDEALSMLARVLILDEENALAREMEQEIRALLGRTHDEIEQRIAEGVGEFELGHLEEARQHFLRVLERSPQHREALDFLERIEANLQGGEGLETSTAAAPAAAPAEHEEDLLLGVEAVPLTRLEEPHPSNDLDPAPSVRADSTGARAVPVARAAKPPRSRASLRWPMWIWAGLLAIAVVAGGAVFFVTSRSSGRSAPAARLAPPAALPRGGAPDRPQSTPQPVPGATRAPAQAPSPADASRGVPDYLSRAHQAFEAGDYGAAVVAYNGVLALDPDNREGRLGILEAGARYKEQQKQQEQLDRARMAFEDQEYASALRLLYRLPKETAPALVERWKVNGWYNLGVIALRGGDCSAAITHLDEALQIQPADEGARRARALAQRYAKTPKDRVYYDHVEALAFRVLSD